MAVMNLRSREGRVLVIGGAVAAGLIVWMLARGPLEQYRKSKDNLRVARQNLSDAQVYHAEIRDERARQEAIRRLMAGTGSFDLWSFLNGVIREMDLDKREARVETYAGGTRSSGLPAVKVELRSVSVDELIAVLHRIYGSGHLIALHSAMPFQQATNGKGLDCTLIFLSPRV